MNTSIRIPGEYSYRYQILKYSLDVFWIFYLAEFWGFFFFLDGHVGGDGRRITEMWKGFFPVFQAQTGAGAANQHTFETEKKRRKWSAHS